MNEPRLIIDDPNAAIEISAPPDPLVDAVLASNEEPEPLVEAPPPAPPQSLELVFWLVDMPWPSKDQREFTAQVPNPAEFHRAYRCDLVVTVTGRKTKHKRPHLRLVFLVNNRGQLLQHRFVLQRHDAGVRVPVEGPGPAFLGVIVGDDANPMALWQLPYVAHRDVKPDNVPKAE